MARRLNSGYGAHKRPTASTLNQKTCQKCGCNSYGVPGLGLLDKCDHCGEPFDGEGLFQTPRLKGPAASPKTGEVNQRILRDIREEKK